MCPNIFDLLPILLLSLILLQAQVFGIVEAKRTPGPSQRHRSAEAFKGQSGLGAILNDTYLWQLTRGKNVHINIGVEVREDRTNRNNIFWVEFDPNVKINTAPTPYSILLPYLAAAESQPQVKFIPHRTVAACSSMFEVRQKYPTIASLRPDFIENCVEVNRTTNGHLRLWDKRRSFAKCVGQTPLKVSWMCQAEEEELPPVHVPAIALAEVVRGVRFVHYLDIDAQGADLEILMSLGSLVRQVKEVKMECQTGMWLYKSRMRNDCNVALVFLLKNGFVLKDLEVNNCGVLEYNLFMTNPHFMHTKGNTSQRFSFSPLPAS